MAAFLLCGQCLARFKKSHAVAQAKAAEGCHICKGLLSKADALIVSALAQAQGPEWETFAVSSSFPKSVFVREQQVADFFSPGDFSSLKNSVNSSLAKLVAAATGKTPEARNPDVSLSFDFSSGKSSARIMPLYVFGRYTKLSRAHCQSRWHCSACRGKGCPECGGSGHNYPSIEEELGSAISPHFGAKEAVLHASGREDVDVRTLGTGRPFVLELKSPAKRHADLAAIERALSSNPAVRANGLRIVSKQFMDAVCNSHFEKEYSALVSAGRPLSSSDAEKISSLNGAVLSQQTPKRVLSRRTDMLRRRKIFSISSQPEGSGKLRLKILAEAGTYIKELISSDGGRTKPSVSGLLGCNAVCEELDVVSIRDWFLETLAV